MKKAKKIITTIKLTTIKGYFLDENEPVSSVVRILGKGYKSDSSLKKAVKEQTGKILLYTVKVEEEEEKREINLNDFIKYSTVVPEEQKEGEK